MSWLVSKSVAVGLAGAAIMVGGYGASQATAAQLPPSAHVSSSRAALATTISIRHFTFHVLSTVAPGHRVKVVNHQGTFHSVTRNGGGFSVVIPPHSTRTFRGPARIGDYNFHCKFHSDMHGTLRVR